MKCARCQAQNREGIKFCEECGARLLLNCPSCNAEVSPDKKFCGSCGAPIAAQPLTGLTSPQAYTPRHLAEKILTSRGALEGERKQVTVLFADLKGSMELLADRDPEEARKILDPILERMMEGVHRYEGTVNQVMGDGIMALFGAPLAHEDHAVRGCYAALRMQESMKQYAEEVHRTFGLPIHIRVGLNSGEVVVRSIGSDLHMDYTAVGQTTHLAARMEQMAMPGSILTTPETLKLAEGYVAVKPLGPRPVKGLDGPIEVYEIVGAGPVRSRLHAAAARGLTRFVGRDTELAQLRQALDRVRAGHGQVVALVGEAGVGKSRLFFEFTHSHRTQGCLLLESSSVSYGKATSYLPVSDLLKAYFEIEDRDTAQRIREKVTGKVLTLDERLKETIPPILSLLEALPEDDPFRSLNPPQRRGRTVDALKQLLLRESLRQPLLLVFEDLHWIDAETQAFLDSLIESLPTTRIFLLLNYRPEYQHGWGSKTYYTQLRLDPLRPESAEELLQALLGGDAGLQPLKQLLIERTEGNPFFLEESVRTLVENQTLMGEPGIYRLANPIETIQVPATVQAVLAARIDRLQPEEKRLLQSAAVIGKDVPFALLGAIAELPEEPLRLGLAQLQAAEFLYEASLFPDLEFTFKHALTHDVAYGSVLQERRRILHRRVAEIIEERYADRLPEFYETLAGHFERGEGWSKAVGYYLSAAGKAKERYAYPNAIRFCARAVEIAGKEDLTDGRVRGLVLLGDLWSLTGDLDQANQSYERVLGATTDPTDASRIANKRHRPHAVVRDGARIAFYEHGSGKETVLLINPLIYGLAVLQPVLEQLCQELRILTIDPRGTGASDPLPDRYSLKDHMEDVRAVIKRADAAPIVGVGISRGGNLLVKLAVAHPELVKKLVLVGTPLDYVPTPRSEEFSEALRRRDFERAMRMFVPTVFSEPGTGDLIEQFVQHCLRLHPHTVLSFFAPDPERNIAPLLHQVRVPTLVTHGTADRRVPFEEGRFLSEHIPGAQLYAFEGRGHLPLFTATIEFCEVVRSFVRTGAVPEAERSMR